MVPKALWGGRWSGLRLLGSELWWDCGVSWDRRGILGFFYGMQGFLLLFSVFSWIFLFCSGGSGVLSHGADSGLGFHG